jgi:predicted nuclease of predicted toxin-antitoxin system
MLLLDQNLSPKLAGILGTEFGMVVHVDTLGMAGDSDTCVWEYAKKNG